MGGPACGFLGWVTVIWPPGNGTVRV